jgi:ribosome-interacting GTPase 1
MPANLTPQYMEAEKKLRTAKTPQEKIEILEELLRLIPKHKGTEKLQAQHKSKIAKLKEEMQKQSGAKRGLNYIIDKQGAGQVIVVGPPNSGKSMLIKALTGADPEVGDYPFTTRAPAPYMMKFDNVRVQLIDLPPMTAELMESWQVELIKVADAALLVVDVANPDDFAALESLLAKLKEKRVEFIPEHYIPPEKEAGPVPYRKRTLLIANKADLDADRTNLETLKVFYGDELTIVPVSSVTGDGIEELKRTIYALLRVIRVYSKAPGKKPERDEPFVLKRGTTVIELARAVHKDFAEKLNYARLWRGAEVAGLMVNRDYVLADEDTVELHL